MARPERPERRGSRPVQRRPAPLRAAPLPSDALSRDRLARVMYSRALTYFNAVAATLSMRGAARELHIASSAVNRQILQLEQAIGQPLFERHGRSLSLSPVGEILARHARKTLVEIEAALEEIDALQELRIGSVRIASIESFASGLLSSVVREFSRRHPRIDISLTVQPSPAINDLVASGDIEIGFTINPPRNARIAVVQKYDLAVGAIVAPGHPLAGRRSVSVAECLAHPVTFGKTLKVGEILEQALEARPAQRTRIIQSDSARFVSTLLQDDDYVAFLHPLGLEPQLSAGELVYIPLAEPRLSGDSFAVITHAGTALRRAPRAFLELAQDMIMRHHPPFTPGRSPPVRRRRGATRRRSPG